AAPQRDLWGLAAGDGRRIRKLPRLLAHGAEEPAFRPLGQLAVKLSEGLLSLRRIADTVSRGWGSPFGTSLLHSCLWPWQPRRRRPARPTGDERGRPPPRTLRRS